MKPFVIFFISAFMCLNAYGQDTYTGKITGMPTPIIPPLPCLIVGLETFSYKYVLTINSHCICGKLIVEDIEYLEGDEVEITGTVTVHQEDIHWEEFISIEIETIKKVVSNIELVFSSNNKVYYDVKNQLIIIDETLQNQSLTFELTDLQGKIILRKTNAGNTISVANLPKGMYLYRLLQNSQTIYFGKILKNSVPN